MNSAEETSATFARQQRIQLEAVQQPLDDYLRQWGLNIGANPVVTTLFLEHELRILSNAPTQAASQLLRVRPLFPGSLSQYDVVVERATESSSPPSNSRIASPTSATETTDNTNTAKLHPISPQFFYERFHRSEKIAYQAIDRCRRMSIFARGAPDGLAQRIINQLSAVKYSHPALFHELYELNLVCLDMRLPKRARNKIVQEVASSLKQSTGICHLDIHVDVIAESTTPAVSGLCVRSWLTLVDDSALAIDILNAGTPCLLLDADDQGSHRPNTRLIDSSAASNAEITPAHLDQPDNRKRLIDQQRRVLVRKTLPKTARTSVHSHFRSLAALLCKTMEEELLCPELTREMRSQLAAQPLSAFCPLDHTPSKSIAHRMHSRRRRTVKKWRKLRNSPKQFVLDSPAIKWALANWIR